MESEKHAEEHDATTIITTSGPEERLSQSISIAFRACLDSFRAFILALDEEDSRGIMDFDVTRLMDEYGRLKIWGDQSGAHLAALARGSLDDTLRQDEQLRKLTIGVLERITLASDDAIHIINHGAAPEGDNSSESDDSFSDLSSDTGSVLDLGSDTGKTKMIAQISKEIFEQIRSLFDLSSLLRRPRIKDRYIRSIRREGTLGTTPPPDCITITDALAAADQHHVIEKLLQWRSLTKSGVDSSCATEVPVPCDQQADHRDLVEPWLVERLARANTRRREQLQYWFQHPYNRESQEAGVRTGPADPPPGMLVTTPHDTSEEGGATKTPITVAPRFLTPSQAGKSTVTRTTFSAAPVSVVLGTKTNIRPKTEYAKTAIGQVRTNSIPKPPRLKDNQASFPCPYCGTTLDAVETQDEQSWKRHVFRDLRPYVCTFEVCQNPEKLYITRHEWRHHEFQIHRREYTCRQCANYTTLSREDMAEHLGTHNPSGIPAHRLGIFLDLCEQQMDDSKQQIEDCLICGDEHPLSRLHNHVAQHMESLALFVLPSAESDSDDDHSHCSSKAARRESQAGRSHSLYSGEAISEGKHKSLPRDGLEHVNNPQDFKTLFTQSERTHADLISSWNAGNESDGVDTKPDSERQIGTTEALSSSPRTIPAAIPEDLKPSDEPQSLPLQEEALRELKPAHEGLKVGPIDEISELRVVSNLLTARHIHLKFTLENEAAERVDFDHVFIVEKQWVEELLRSCDSLRVEHDLDRAVEICSETFKFTKKNMGLSDPITLGFADLLNALLLRTKRKNALEEWLLSLYISERDAGPSALEPPLNILKLFVELCENPKRAALGIYALLKQLTASQSKLSEGGTRAYVASVQLADVLIEVRAYNEAEDLLRSNLKLDWYSDTREAREAELNNYLSLAVVCMAKRNWYLGNSRYQKEFEEAEDCCRKALNALNVQPRFDPQSTLKALDRIEEVMQRSSPVSREACQMALELRRPPCGQEPSIDFIRNMYRLVEQFEEVSPRMHVEAWSLDLKLRALAKRHKDLFSLEEFTSLAYEHVTQVESGVGGGPKFANYRSKEVETVEKIQYQYHAWPETEVSKKLRVSSHPNQDWVPHEDEQWTTKAIEMLQSILEGLVGCIGETRCRGYQPYLQRQEDLADIFYAMDRTAKAEELYTHARDGFARLPEREPDDVSRVEGKLSALRASTT